MNRGEQRNARQRSNPRTTRQEHVDASKQSNLALQKAFTSVSQKYRKLQEDYERVYHENLKAQTDKATLIRENEILKQNLEKGFKAFDDKFKETEQLKKELDQKEKENTESTSPKTCNEEDPSAYQENSKSLVVATNINCEQSTQTESEITVEEKTDDVIEFHDNFKKLLKVCGLEIVVQENKLYLMVTDRDRLKHWVEDATDGKVSLDFDRTQTSDTNFDKKEGIKEDIHKLLHEKDKLIIILKSKVAQQADQISGYHTMLSKMEHSKAADTTVLSEHKQTLKTRCGSIEKYHQNLHKRLQEVLHRMILLKQQTEFQQQYIHTLVSAMKRVNYVPKHLKLLSEVAQAGKLIEKKREREVKEPPDYPVTAEHIEEDEQVEETPTEQDQSAEDGLYSIAVQETDKYPTYDLSKSSDTSASIITISEGRISDRGKSGSGSSQAEAVPRLAPAVQNSESLPVKVKTKTKTETAGTSRERNTEEQQDDNDDIVVINEEEAAVGGAPRMEPGSKQCPVCFITFSPSSSQTEFENHVLAHFQD